MFPVSPIHQEDMNGVKVMFKMYQQLHHDGLSRSLKAAVS